jgi:hypothetical protein
MTQFETIQPKRKEEKIKRIEKALTKLKVAM